MTMKKIMEKIDRIINNAEYMYNISGDDEDGKIYHAFGEGSFPVRLSLRQVYEVADYLSDCGYTYWIDEPVRIYPKAVYRLWVNIRPESWLSSNYEYRWGLKRVTESPNDTMEAESGEKSRRRVRERRVIDIPDF